MYVLVAVVVLVVGVVPARAEPRQISWADICTLAYGRTNQDRFELAPTVGASLGNGEADRYLSGGLAFRYQLSDELLVAVTLRMLAVSRTAPLPTAVERSVRTGAFTYELGYSPLFGKLALGRRTFVELDLVATAGVGVVTRDDPDETRAYIAFPAGILLRVGVLSSVSIELGLHDDIVPWRVPPPSVVARSLANPPVLAPSAHELEVTIGIGVWFPAVPAHRCRMHCP